jgi:hypothetical protein
MTKSMAALMDLGDLVLSHLRLCPLRFLMALGEVLYTKAFMLHWIDKLRLFHELTPILTDHHRLSENTQGTLLQNAVQGLDILGQVQINSDLQKVAMGILTFAQYCTLLLNTATGYDNPQAKSTSNGKPRRSVFNSEILFDDHDDVICDDDTTEFDYGIDTLPAKLQAFLRWGIDGSDHSSSPDHHTHALGRWKALSEQAKKIWDQIDDDDKAKILALLETRKPAPQSSQTKFSVNSHDAIH